MDKCVEHNTCPGSQPIQKPIHARRFPADFYYPAYCNYCYGFKPLKETASDKPELSYGQLVNRLNSIEGIANYAKNKLQEHTSHKKYKYNEYE